MKKFFAILFVVAFSAPVFAQDDVKIDPFLRLKMVDDTTTKTNAIDLDLSGIQISKKFSDNLSMTVTPGVYRGSIYNMNPAANANLSFALVEGFFAINDISKGYGDYGLGLVAGQYESPFYKMEQYYQPFRFIYSPLDSKLMSSEYVDLGLMMTKSFLENAINLSLGYVSGLNYFTDPSDGAVNAGGAHLVANFAPFKKFGEGLKDLSLTFNLKSVFRATARSNYNFLLGYKYEKFATSLEYLKSYSSVRATDIQAVSFGASYDVWGPIQALARWDYSDDKSAVDQHDHLFLLGMNTKWFDSKLQTALTYDQEYDPSAKTTIAKRIMVATQVSL
jgi:hypothetical protein